MNILPSRDDETGWRNLLFAAAWVTTLVYLYQAFFVPGTLAYSPYTIQDDARLFLSWASRLEDAGALRGDLLADYWQSVSPWLYRELYHLADLLGVPPLLFAKLLPIPLLFVSAWMGWRIALLLTKKPLAAFVSAALLTSFVLHEDSIYSATPRAFSPPLFLVFIDGLLRNRGRQMIASLFLAALLYPTTALVGLTMLGLSRIDWRPFRIDLGRRTLVLCITAAFAVGAAILAFAGASTQWGPTLDLADAMTIDGMNTGLARTAVVGLSGRVDLVCQARMGFLPEIVPCWLSGWAWLPNLLLMVPLLAFAWAAVRKGAFRVDGESGNLIYAWALLAATAWWIVAIIFAFKLHLPSRYTQRTLSLLEFLAIGQWIGLWLHARLERGKRGGATRVVAGLVAAFFCASFPSPTPGLTRPRDDAAIARLAALPDAAVIGGVSDQLDYLPALTGRRTLAGAEHAIPYQFGYFKRLRARLDAAIVAVSSPDQQVLDDYVTRYGISVIVVDDDFIADGELPPRWAKVRPTQIHAAEQRMARAEPAFLKRAPDCIIHNGTLVLLDAACLTEASADAGPRPSSD